MTILAYFDGSASAVRAVGHAAGHAQTQRQPLVVLDVWDENILSGLLPSELPDRAELLDEIRADTDAQLAELIRDTAMSDGDWQVIHVVGDAFKELTSLAADLHADLIVLGAPLHPPWPRRRALAVRLARLSQWPVSVVP